MFENKTEDFKHRNILQYSINFLSSSKTLSFREGLPVTDETLFRVSDISSQSNRKLIVNGEVKSSKCMLTEAYHLGDKMLIRTFTVEIISKFEKVQ